MGNANREIEVKLRVASPSGDYADVCALLRAAFGSRLQREVEEKSTDVYWAPTTGSRADFARVRTKRGGKAQLTVKSTDRRSNLNRIEIDLEVDSRDKAVAFLRELTGCEAAGLVTKTYCILFLKDMGHANVSVYQIEGSPDIYVEIEADTEQDVESLLKNILSIPDAPKFARVYNSLYDMYVAKIVPKTKVVTHANLSEICRR